MNIKDFEEKQLESELIYDGKIVHLYKDKIEQPNGRKTTREYVKHIGAVCVVPITDKNEVICVRQYRYPFSDVLLEIPAGKLDSKDEDPLEAAKRELREETGALSDNITFIGKYYSSPAILDECIYMYMAKDLTYGETDLDEGEFLEDEKIPMFKLVNMICNGEVKDGKTQAAVLKAAFLLNHGREN